MTAITAIVQEKIFVKSILSCNLVSIRSISTIDGMLFGESSPFIKWSIFILFFINLVLSDDDGSFKSGESRECPARSTLTLVLNWPHDSLTPVNRFI